MPDGKKEGRSKADDKAQMKEKANQKEWELANGITKPVKQAMNADKLLCMECKATQLGPTKCECVGGRRPPTGGYAESAQGQLDLAAAAKVRLSAQSVATKAAQAAAQGSVQKAKEKAKAGKLVDDLGNLDLSQLDFMEIEFHPGKLGFSIERNAVTAVTEGGPADEKKVKVGWVIRKVQGEDAPSDKAKLMKMAAAAMKQGPTTFVFQTPLEDDTHFCKDCDKFVSIADFDDGALDAGPGKQVCYSCSEYADMGW